MLSSFVHRVTARHCLRRTQMKHVLLFFPFFKLLPNILVYSPVTLLAPWNLLANLIPSRTSRHMSWVWIRITQCTEYESLPLAQERKSVILIQRSTVDSLSLLPVYVYLSAYMHFDFAVVLTFIHPGHSYAQPASVSCKCTKPLCTYRSIEHI